MQTPIVEKEVEVQKINSPVILDSSNKGENLSLVKNTIVKQEVPGIQIALQDNPPSPVALKTPRLMLDTP